MEQKIYKIADVKKARSRTNYGPRQRVLDDIIETFRGGEDDEVPLTEGQIRSLEAALGSDPFEPMKAPTWEDYLNLDANVTR